VTKETTPRDITFKTDQYGSVLGNITISGRATVLDLTNGSVTSNGTTLTLASQTGSVWNQASNVQFINATAGISAAPVSLSSIFIDPETGNLLIEGSGTTAPSGPYSVEVCFGGDLYYILNSNASGSVTSIVPGTTLLALTSGSIVRNGTTVATVATENTITGMWSQSGSITNLTAATSSGSAINVFIDATSGNIVTNQAITGSVVVTFSYTDASGDIIQYVITVLNGGIVSYTGSVTNPGANFNYSTVTNVTVSLKVADAVTGLGIPTASISFVNSSGTVWQGFTDSTGQALFSSTVATISTITAINATHDGYTAVNSPVSNVANVIAIAQNITMTPIPAVTPPVVDPSNTFGYITNTYTFAFEDNYTSHMTSVSTGTVTWNSSDQIYQTSGNDCDFNDLVVQLSITEQIDGNNMVRAITLAATPKATLAGYSDSFGVDINYYNSAGTLVNYGRYVLIANPKNANGTTNTTQVTQTITLNGTTGIARTSMAPFPLDPFMVPNGGSSSVGTAAGVPEVHFLSVPTLYTGVRSASGVILTSNSSNGTVPIKNFVWALIVPNNWCWPTDGTSIGIAYPQFVSWCNSGGTTNQTWYNYPVSNSKYVTQ
jgi:hypothetical protein